MTIVFQPRLYNGSTHFVLPQPIASIVPQFQWKADVFESPLVIGATSHDNTLGPLTYQISGEIGWQDATKKIAEADMLGVLEALLDYIKSPPANGFEFFTHYDLATTTYRKWKRVFPTGFSYDFGDQAKHVNTYSLSLRCDDPTRYSTAAGA